MLDKQYNLRSTKRDSIQIPVQVFCGDSEFSSQMGGSPNMKQSQVTSSEDSDLGSELDCSGLVAESDNDTKMSQLQNSNPLTGVDQASASNTTDGNAQALVNQEILKQLTKLGQKLDVLEKGGCKKTKDPVKMKSATTRNKSKTQKLDQSQISQSTVSAASSLQNKSVPQLNALRQDAHVQQVQQRLLELNEIATSGKSSKIKSQRGGGGLTCLSSIMLDGHKNLYYLALIRKGFLMIN